MVCDERSTEMDHFLNHYIDKYPFEKIRILVPYVDGTNKRTGERPASETGSTDDDLLGFSKNRHNPVMVYNDLMIRNTTVHDYNKNRSQPVTIQCPITWVGAPVDRRRQTGMICPNRALISVRIIVPFSRMASRPLSAAHQLILAIYIV